MKTNFKKFNIERIIRPVQKQLFALLKTTYKENLQAYQPDKYILVQGEAPILLVAHLDTVHQTPVKTICYSKNGNILMSPEGIGGDDRCGVYALTEIYRRSKVKPWLLFTCDEEIGGDGAEQFADDFEKNLFKNILPNIKLIIEIDRKGNKDAVYYSCDCPELETYIATKGYKTEFGSFSDISIIAPVMEVAAVNLSSGYYNPHQSHEYINLKELERTIQAVINITKESNSNDFPVYKYKEKPYKSTKLFNYPYGIHTVNWREDNGLTEFETPPKDLPEPLNFAYSYLLDIYTKDELESMRSEFGDKIIEELYNDESSYETNLNSYYQQEQDKCKI